MASKALKGLTVKIGGDTTELTKALDKVEKQGRDLSSELGQINKLLKFDPKNTELLAQKQEVLAEAIGGAEDKLKTLREAEKQVQAQFKEGKVSEEQVRALQREIIATEAKLNKYKNEAQETADAVKDLGNESDKAADHLKEQADSADDAEGSIQNLGEGAENVAKVGLLALAGAATAVAAGIKSVVEETAEYRREMAKLDTAYTKSGHSTEAAYKTYSELQSILGESEEAVEASNFIAKLSRNEQDLAKWTEICTGVYGEFGSSLPVSALMESANESANVGQIAGNLADALNWAAEEGETFGVTLKENIDFTKLSEKELEKLTTTQRAEYEARKAQYEEIEAYNQKVMEAASAEDFFNIALENCTTEQERQTLILETLSGKYSDSAASFKEANKEVIAQNQASEKLNATWAKVGQKAAPIVTTFTEGLAELAEAFLEVIEDADLDPIINGIKKGFTNLSQKALPKLIKALEWVADNFDTLKALAVGFIAALAAKKVANFATTVGTNLTKAFKSATKGMKGLNAAAKANIYMTLASAIIGVGTALSSYFTNKVEAAEEAMRAASEKAYGLTDADKALGERIRETSEALQERRKEMDSSIGAINAQFNHLSSLRSELGRLVDAEGHVSKANQARVDFILGELNNALGTEYTRTGDIIGNYKELATSIDEYLLKKKTELLLSVGEEAYAEALRSRQQAENDFYNNTAALQESYIQGEDLKRKINEAFLNMQAATDQATRTHYWELQQQYVSDYQAWQKAHGEKQKTADESKANLEEYYIAIGQYETAMVQSLEGNTEEASRIMSDRAYYMEKYADTFGFESEEVMNTWELQAAEAGVKAKTTRDNWKKGVAGYTEEMVKEAEDGYDDALGAFESAYVDAYNTGQDVTDGMVAGLERGSPMVTMKFRQLITRGINAAKEAGDINSPSKKMIEVGEYMGEGAEIGLEKTTGQVVGAAANQVQGILSAYEGLKAPTGMQSLERITNSATARQATEMSGLASANQPILEKILKTIEEGQVIILDGDALVGATADRMDNALGRRRALASRGAI